MLLGNKHASVHDEPDPFGVLRVWLPVWTSPYQYSPRKIPALLHAVRSLPALTKRPLLILSVQPADKNMALQFWCLGPSLSLGILTAWLSQFKLPDPSVSIFVTAFLSRESVVRITELGVLLLLLLVFCLVSFLPF